MLDAESDKTDYTNPDSIGSKWDIGSTHVEVFMKSGIRDDEWGEVRPGWEMLEGFMNSMYDLLDVPFPDRKFSVEECARVIALLLRNR